MFQPLSESLGEAQGGFRPLEGCLSAGLPQCKGRSPPSTWEPREAPCVVLREVRCGGQGQGQEPSLFGEMFSGGQPPLLLALLGTELVSIYMDGTRGPTYYSSLNDSS